MQIVLQVTSVNPYIDDVPDCKLIFTYQMTIYNKNWVIKAKVLTIRKHTNIVQRSEWGEKPKAKVSQLPPFPEPSSGLVTEAAAQLGATISKNVEECANLFGTIFRKSVQPPYNRSNYN